MQDRFRDFFTGRIQLQEHLLKCSVAVVIGIFNRDVLSRVNGIHDKINLCAIIVRSCQAHDLLVVPAVHDIDPVKMVEIPDSKQACAMIRDGEAVFPCNFTSPFIGHISDMERLEACRINKSVNSQRIEFFPEDPLGKWRPADISGTDEKNLHQGLELYLDAFVEFLYKLPELLIRFYKVVHGAAGVKDRGMVLVSAMQPNVGER